MIPCKLYMCRFCRIVYCVGLDDEQGPCVVCGCLPEYYGELMECTDVRLLEKRMDEKDC